MGLEISELAIIKFGYNYELKKFNINDIVIAISDF